MFPVASTRTGVPSSYLYSVVRVTSCVVSRLLIESGQTGEFGSVGSTGYYGTAVFGTSSIRGLITTKNSCLTAVS